EIDPADEVAQASYAFCLERTGRTKESTLEYEKLESISAEKSNFPLANREYYLYSIGRNYLREENVVKAEETFRQNSGFQPAEFQLAKILVRSDRSEEALAIIERNLERSPNSLFFRLLQTQAFESLGRMAEAKEAADKLERAMYIVQLSFNINLVKPYSVRHGVQKELQEYFKLIELNDMDHLARKLNKILKLIGERPMPQHRSTLISMIEVELQRKDPKRMLMLLDQLNQYGIEDADILQFKAGAYMLSGDMEQAIPLLQRVAKMSPTIEVHQTLANYYDQKKDTKKRDAHLAKISLLYAMIAFRNNQLPAAEESIQRSIELNPNDPQAWFYNAETKRVLGDLKAANTAYQRCIALNPNHGRALRELALLTPEKNEAK
ncbi:MAG: tetratricopeptide repeat protein, partial [Gimesia sp.]